MPEVSVIIPVYNGEKFIKEALDSVFAQTFHDFEIIVVNDGSTDSTERSLSKYMGQITYVVQMNQGQSVSRRRGLQESTGNFVAFLDADDIWIPRKLERQVGFALAHPEYGIVTTDVASFEDQQTVLSSLKQWHQIPDGYVLENLLFDNWIPPSAALVRRECFDRVTTFDVPPPCFGEDWMMWMEIAAHYPIHFVDEVLVCRRLHPESVSSQADEVQFRCLLRNLEIMEERIPQFRAQPALIREAAFRICFRRGLGDLQAIRVLAARDKLRRAIGYRPYSVEAWMLFAGTFVPAPALHGLKRGVKTFRRFGSRIHTRS